MGQEQAIDYREPATNYNAQEELPTYDAQEELPTYYDDQDELPAYESEIPLAYQNQNSVNSRK
jgi:hypothetical protein